MKKNKTFIIILSLTLTFSILFFIYHKTNFIQNEGFNPSDEGVVVAQSYRLVNGEIPHKDFIAIRPVFSGIIHMIHFISPIPLVESGRWFVLFENFLIALFLVLLVKSLFFKSSRLKDILPFLITSSIFAFLLNINIYTFFPWTTVDAILFSIIGLYFINTGLKKERAIHTTYIAIGLFTLSISALCRQTFILLPAILSLIILVISLKYKQKLLKLALMYLIGFLPIAIYLIYLYVNNALSLFINQITGRSELIETGVITFIRYLSQSYFLPIYFVVFAFLAYRKMVKAIPVITNLHKKIFYGFTLLSSFTLGIMIFFLDFTNFFKVPFELFFIAIAISIFYISSEKLRLDIFIFILSILLIGWISSISLGDNAPIFTTGILFCFSLTISVKALSNSRILRSYIMIPLTILFIVLSINKQRKINYRDLGYQSLNYNLGEIHHNFGSIRTNRNTYKYYNELIKITEQLKRENRTFTIVPNNAMFYPLTNFQNRFPLDWMQSAEYIGNSKYVHEKITSAINKDIDYIILEKINSKVMQHELVLLDLSEKSYDYMPLIYKFYKKTSYQGDFFMIMEKERLN